VQDAKKISVLRDEKKDQNCKIKVWRGKLPGKTEQQVAMTRRAWQSKIQGREEGPGHDKKKKHERCKIS